MSNNTNLHQITNLRIMVSEPREDVVGRVYCVTKCIAEDEDGRVHEMVLFGKGIQFEEGIEALEVKKKARTQVHPFVEYERPSE